MNKFAGIHYLWFIFAVVAMIGIAMGMMANTKHHIEKSETKDRVFTILCPLGDCPTQQR